MKNIKAIYECRGKVMGRYRCVTMPRASVHEEEENLLAGSKGEIREFKRKDGSAYYVAVTVYYYKGEMNERLIPFESKDLDKWVLRLCIPVKPIDQLIWANNPNKRLDQAVSYRRSATRDIGNA